MEKIIGIVAANYSDRQMEGLTDTRTLASLPFGSQYRMIDFALSSFVNSGITSVGIIIPAQSRSLLDHVGFGKNWRLDRKVGGMFFLPESGYRRDRSKIGYFLNDMSNNKEFLIRTSATHVAYSCTHMVYNINYEHIYDKMRVNGADIMLVTSRRIRNFETCLKVTTDKNGKVKNLTGNPVKNDLCFVDSFVIRRELLLTLAENCDVTDSRTLLDIICANIKNWSIYVHEHMGYVGNISSVYDYFKCNLDLLAPSVRQEQIYSKCRILTKVQDSVPTRYYKNSNVSNSLINSNGNIFGTVENSILFHDVYISEGAVVRNSIIMPGGRVGQYAVVENAIIDKKCIVNDGSILRGQPEDPLVVRKEN